MNPSPNGSGSVKGPYSQADVDRWNNDLRVIDQVRQEIELATAAGFPCAEFDSACKAMYEQLMTLKKVYAPGQP